MSVGILSASERRSEAARKAHATRRKAADVFNRVAEFEARLVAIESRPAGGSSAPAVPLPPRVLEIRRPERKPVVMDDDNHPAFDEVILLAEARKPIFLPGPAGCGKSMLARKVAKGLGLGFGSFACSPGMSESDLIGRLLPVGENGRFEYVSTDFIRSFENGGVFLLDEIDAGDAAVLVKLNDAIANGELFVPARHEKPLVNRHADFVLIAAANTFGRGGDRMYVGRNPLDESTLDRFRVGTVDMDYDADFERKLIRRKCGEYGKAADFALYERLAGYRKKILENRVERVISTRFILDAYDMVVGWGWSDVKAEEKLFKGWTRDELRKVKGA